MKLVIPKGDTSRIVTVFIQDSSSTTGAGLGSLVHTSSIVGGYVREGGTGVALAVDEDVATEGTYQAPSSAGQVRIGAPANLRTGTYELHFHNDLWATGAEAVTITLGGATNMADLPIEVQLSDPVRGLGSPTALPNAAADDAGGLPISDAGGLDLDAKLATATSALATTAELNKVPKSDGTTSWNSTALAAIESEANDALTAFWTSPATLVDLVWDEPLTGGTHNVATSAGRRLRQIDAAFEVHSGTAQAGTSTTITLDTGASATDNIYNGDRIVIVGGTGAQEHGLVVSYNGTTKVATMSKAWVITPDNTSEFEVVPADCDVETWNEAAVTGDGDWAELQTDVDDILLDTNELQTDDVPGLIAALNNIAATDIVSGGAINTASGVAEANAVALQGNTLSSSVGDNFNTWFNAGGIGNAAWTIGNVYADTNELQQDWANGGRLDLILDIIAADTTTDIPALIATAQGDLDTITGTDGATLATVQANYAPSKAGDQMDLVNAPNATAIAAIFGTALNEAYRSTGATGTAAQLLYEILAHLGEMAISGTTKTTKKLDGATTAKTYTLDDATSPTSITEAT